MKVATWRMNKEPFKAKELRNEPEVPAKVINMPAQFSPFREDNQEISIQLFRCTNDGLISVILVARTKLKKSRGTVEIDNKLAMGAFVVIQENTTFGGQNC
jgi:hypothetical protein